MKIILSIILLKTISSDIIIYKSSSTIYTIIFKNDDPENKEKQFILDEMPFFPSKSVPIEIAKEINIR